jgi:hypothetical protein
MKINKKINPIKIIGILSYFKEGDKEPRKIEFKSEIENDDFNALCFEVKFIKKDGKGIGTIAPNQDLQMKKIVDGMKYDSGLFKKPNL